MCRYTEALAPESASVADDFDAEAASLERAAERILDLVGRCRLTLSNPC